MGPSHVSPVFVGRDRELALLMAALDSAVAAEPACPPGAPARRDPRARTARAGQDREREVLALVAEGHSNPQTAETLFISRKTASVHVSNILGKLGVASRGEAGAFAHRHGLGATAPRAWSAAAEAPPAVVA